MMNPFASKTEFRIPFAQYKVSSAAALRNRLKLLSVGSFSLAKKNILVKLDVRPFPITRAQRTFYTVFEPRAAFLRL